MTHNLLITIAKFDKIKHEQPLDMWYDLTKFQKETINVWSDSGHLTIVDGQTDRRIAMTIAQIIELTNQSINQSIWCSMLSDFDKQCLLDTRKTGQVWKDIKQSDE